MNHPIGNLLKDLNYGKIIQQKLPPAFQMVGDELKGNPAVGLLREQVIIGMLCAFLGKDKINLVESGVNPEVDCFIGSEALSIKTVSLSSEIRISWTSNAIKATRFIDEYEPKCDLLITRIAWNAMGSMKFIPLGVQTKVLKEMGIERYLDYRGATNTRGVNLSQEAEIRLYNNSESINLDIFWRRSNEITNPIQRWIDYWKDK